MGLHDLAWIEAGMPQDGSARITDANHGTVLHRAVGDPRARDLLSRVCDDDLSNDGFPYMTAKRITIGEVPALALRISYIGELGWEIYAPAEMGRAAVGFAVGSRSAAWRHRGGRRRV